MRNLHLTIGKKVSFIIDYTHTKGIFSMSTAKDFESTVQRPTQNSAQVHRILCACAPVHVHRQQSSRIGLKAFT